MCIFGHTPLSLEPEERQAVRAAQRSVLFTVSNPESPTQLSLPRSFHPRRAVDSRLAALSSPHFSWRQSPKLPQDNLLTSASKEEGCQEVNGSRGQRGTDPEDPGCRADPEPADPPRPQAAAPSSAQAPAAPAGYPAHALLPQLPSAARARGAPPQPGARSLQGRGRARKVV